MWPAAASKMEVNIEIISKQLIRPSVPTPPENKDHKPSFLDQLSPPCFIPLVFLFHQNQPGCSTEIVDPWERSQRLKQSLSECLTKFYPLAGKVNGDHSVDCDDSGALFVEAKVHSSFSLALQDARLEILNHFLPFEPIGKDMILDTYPRNEILFGVQISWFECGGNAVGVCISHKVADFASLVTFMNAWAAANRGESTSSTNPDLEALNKPNFELRRHLFPPLDLFPGSHMAPPAEKGETMCKRFLFDKEKISELKQLATSSSPGTPATPLVKDPTRVEVVTAFLWKHFINVAGAKNQANEKTLMFTAKHTVNLRSRMSSLASSKDEFPFGNFSIPTSASFISDDHNEQGKDYQDLVWLTSAAIRKVNEDHVIKSVIPYLTNLCGGRLELPQNHELKMRDLLFIIWCRFPIYEVDFGWGKPVYVCPAGTPGGAGVMLLSTRCGDGIEAWIGLAEEEMEMLPEELLSLATSDIIHVN